MLLEQLHEVIQAYPELFGVLMFCCGALIGHRLALGRDKRKEINEVLDRIRAGFEGQADDPYPRREVLTDDVGLLRHHLSRRQKKTYDPRIEDYKLATGNESVWLYDELHNPSYKNPEIVAQAARDILLLLKRR